MKYKFSETLEQYYPFNEKPVMESADGFELYKGDKVYRLKDTDKVFCSEQEYIQYVIEEFTEIEEVE
jgi:hypothetical protein